MPAVRAAAAAWGTGLAVLSLALASPAAAAPQFTTELRGVSDKALRGEIQATLSTFPTGPDSRLEARRRAEDAAQKVIVVLRSEGYYDYQVTPDIGDGDAPPPFVTIQVGPRSTIQAPAVAWSGTAPDAQATEAADKALGLKVGAPGRAEDVIAAEGRVVAALREAGYADAEAQPREVIVDHADHSLTPTFHIAAGSAVRLGGVVIKGATRTRAAWVRALAPWKRGQVYRPEPVAELERRLIDTGAFDSVVVGLAPADQAQGGLRPVIVDLTDRPRGRLELGGSYSTTQGAGVDSRWIVYNRFNRADTLTTSLKVAEIESRLETDLELPDWGEPGQTLKLDVAGYNDDTPAYVSSGGTLGAELTRRWGKLSFVSYGVSFDGSTTSEKESSNYIQGQRIRVLYTTELLGAFNLDNSNDPLDPSKGWRVEGQVEPTYAFGDGPIGYLKVEMQATAYQPVTDWGTVIAARLKLGTIMGGDIPLVPAQDRFFSGGGGSVRGYGYQEVGPRYPDNTPEGGLSLTEGSLELRQSITSQWAVAVFADAGDVGQRVNPDLSHVEVGVGAGVRYNLGFGPIRVDLATPLDRRPGDGVLQLYISIGQSF